MKAPKINFSSEEVLSVYKSLVLPRIIEERMLILLRQNKISKWFSGMGQEAIAVGTALAAHSEDHIMTMHRNLGVFTTRKVPLYNLFCQLFGRRDGFTRGRERSFHFGLTEYRIVGMISHLAAMIPVADGLALGAKLKKENRVAIAFTGDGATSEGDFHEALNLAAVWKLPMICIIENNGYGLSTPVSEQYACESLADRAIGYGMESMVIDGNNIMEVISAVKKAREMALEGKPVLIEAKTFRMRGHEEASGTAYIPDELFQEWATKDPILRFESLLVDEYGFSRDTFKTIKEELKDSIKDDIQKALDCPLPDFDEQRELNAVYVDAKTGPTSPPAKENTPGDQLTKGFRYVDGIRHVLQVAMEADPSTLIMGQDIAEYGGVFKITEKFTEMFGKDRVRNTPIIESGAIGAAYGLALDGYKPIVEMQFADFITCGFNQIVNNLCKSHYRWSPPINVTIRAPYGGGVGAGPFHSQCPEGWFMQHPGIKIAVPATVEDAQIMTWSALHDPNPTIIFEHKKLYRSLRGQKLDNIPYEEIGKARVHRSGRDVSIITYGMGVHWANDLAIRVAEEDGVSVEILDLRSLAPLDIDAIVETVSKTGRVLLLQEPSAIMGPMSEVAAIISERCFSTLDAPVMRCSSLDTPVPTNTQLEQGYLAVSRLDNVFNRLMSY
ncbi:MAG: dehydrogenase [Bacteroidetes bacterium]|nr:dehydrogenase [Bacteroidota bacterium]